MPTAGPEGGSSSSAQDGVFCGRERELALLHDRLRRSADGTAQLIVVDGPPGIGKTALVRRFLRQVAPDGALIASGEENESALQYGVLAQLLARSPSEGPAATVESLLRETDLFSAGARLLDLVGHLRDTGPTVILIDDIHWADPASLQAVTFALRRMRFERIFAVLVTRDPGDPDLPEGFRRLLTDEDTTRLSLAGLDTEEIHRLGEKLLPGRVPSHAAGRLCAHTDGNPLHVRALLRQVPAEILAAPDTPLPAPRSYALLVLADLARCDRAAQDLVTATSVLGMSCPLHLAARLADVEEPLPALEQAVARGLLEEQPTAGAPGVRFPHPMVRAAVYESMGPGRRSALHTTAAALTDDKFAGTWHKLLAAQGPDGELAAELAAGARYEAAAGRWAGAATLAGHAARLAVTINDREELAINALDALLLDGRVHEAAEMMNTLSESALPARRRYASGSVALVRGNVGEALVLLDDAWMKCDEAADPVLAGRIAERLTYACIALARGDAAVLWARRALSLPPPPIGSGGMTRYSQLVALGMNGAVPQAMAILAGLPEAPLVGRADVDLLLGRGMIRVWADELPSARHDLTAAMSISRDGPVPLRILAGTLLGQVERRTGRWEDAIRYLETASMLATDAAQAWLEPLAHAEAASVLALRGDRQRAGEHITAACASDSYGHTVSSVTYVAVARGHLATAVGAPQEAVSVLRPLLYLDGPNEPGIIPWRDLLADALIALAEYEEAASVLTPLEKAAADLGRRSALAAAARVRGRLLAVAREPGAAETAFRSALDHAAEVANPFERARVELDFGAFLRRAGRRSAAADVLTTAHATLTALDATPFLTTCERELRACGHAVAPAVPSAVLTPQELAVARLATTGFTNRQIARELILSIKTVEYHLSNIYAKFGISSRTAIAGKLAPVM
ncbi:AAA family ATPase [Streptomyces sp. NPDC001070]